MQTKNNKILLATSSFASQDKTALETLLSAGYEAVFNPYKRKLTKTELLKLLQKDNIVGTIAGLEIYDKEVMKKTKIKVISRVGSGVSNIDFEAAKKFNIQIFATPLAPIDSVAELTIGVLLSLIRRVNIMDKNLHNKKWERKIGFELKGKTVLIIGFGNIGKKIFEILKIFGANIIISDPFIKNKNIPLCSLEKGLPKADIITIHSSGENCILGKKEFNLMKKGVFILNVARGGLVSEKELIKSLDEKKVAGVWLDTFSEEPYDGALCNYKQAILTPHIGSYTFECRKNMELEAVKNLIFSLKKIGETNETTITAN